MKKKARKKGVKLDKAAEGLHAKLRPKLSWPERQRLLLRKAIGDFIREKGLGENERVTRQLLEFADKNGQKARSAMTTAGGGESQALGFAGEAYAPPGTASGGLVTSLRRRPFLLLGLALLSLLVLSLFMGRYPAPYWMSPATLWED